MVHRREGVHGQDHRALHHVFQFPHVARPGVLHEDLHGVGMELQERTPAKIQELIVLPAVEREEVVHQRGDIFPTLAQRGQRDRGRTTDSSLGQRAMQTFRNDPKMAPSTAKIGA